MLEAAAGCSGFFTKDVDGRVSGKIPQNVQTLSLSREDPDFPDFRDLLTSTRGFQLLSSFFLPSSFLPSYLPSFPPFLILSFHSTFLPSFLLSSLSTILLSFLPTFLPSYLHSFLTSFSPPFLLTCFPSFFTFLLVLWFLEPQWILIFHHLHQLSPAKWSCVSEKRMSESSMAAVGGKWLLSPWMFPQLKLPPAHGGKKNPQNTQPRAASVVDVRGVGQPSDAAARRLF